MLLPEQTSGTSKLVRWLNQLLQCVAERTPLPGDGLFLRKNSNGYSYSLNRSLLGLDAILAIKEEYSASVNYVKGDIVPYGSVAMDVSDRLTLRLAGVAPGLYMALKTTKGNAPTGASSDTNWRQLVQFGGVGLALVANSGSGKIELDPSIAGEVIMVRAVPCCETVESVLTQGYRYIVCSEFHSGELPS